MSRTLKGFTLIEILVVMTLLSMIMLAMGSAFRSMAQTETRVDERVQRLDEMRVDRQFLEKTLGRIDIVKNKNPNNPTAQNILFAAQPDSLSWLGIMPARYGAGGRYYFRLSLEELGQSKALILRYAPWATTSTGFPEWSGTESHVLARDVTDFHVEAEGLPVELASIPATWPRGWQVGWPVNDAGPQRLRLTWADQRGPWPPMVISLVPTVQSQPSYSGFVVGGAKR